MNSIEPFLIILGIAQDGGIPQAGAHRHPAWRDALLRRRAACLGIVDPLSNERWMIEATPDFREQLFMLDMIASQHDGITSPQPAHTRFFDPYPGGGSRTLSGIAITHAHIGHYTGLIHLGREVMNTREIPLYVMPQMASFLRSNAPWSGLVDRKNITVVELVADRPLHLNERLTLTPLPVPHRDEYSETVGFIMAGPQRRVLFLPDIDNWNELDEWGRSIESILADVDIAYLDATFFDRNELPGRDMSAVPHPTITESLERFAALPEKERRKIRFIHLNHTNPALDPDGAARRMIEITGMRVAEEGESESL